MRRSYVTGLATGAVAAGIAGGLIAGIPALADNSTAKPSPGSSGRPDHRPGGGPGGGAFGALHGEFTAKDDKGVFVLRDIQRGQVTAVSGGSLTVKSEDGVSWVWAINGQTKVGRDQQISSIKTGDTVHVNGTRSGQTRTAVFVGEPGEPGDRGGPGGPGDGKGHRGRPPGYPGN